MGCTEKSEKPERILFTCSGCCIEGEVSDKVGRQLRAEGFARCGSSCLAGIGAGYPRFLKAVAEASHVVVIDGCPMACAKTMLNKAQITSESYVLTKMGFDKNKDPEEFIPYACEAIKSVLNKHR